MTLDRPFKHLNQAAIEFHLEGLRENGSDVPEAVSICEYVQAGFLDEDGLPGKYSGKDLRGPRK